MSTIRGDIQYLLWALGEWVTNFDAVPGGYGGWWPQEVLDRNVTIRDGFPLIRKISGLVLVSFYYVNANSSLEVILHSKTCLSDNSFMLYTSGNLEISISEGLPYTCNFL